VKTGHYALSPKGEHDLLRWRDAFAPRGASR
jgi:hypothetical protein